MCLNYYNKGNSKNIPCLPVEIDIRAPIIASGVTTTILQNTVEVPYDTIRGLYSSILSPDGEIIKFLDTYKPQLWINFLVKNMGAFKSFFQNNCLNEVFLAKNCLKKGRP